MREHMICKKCRYFRPFMGGEGQSGECRRYPPRIIAGARPDADTDFDNNGYWPVVGGGDWCGEWHTKEE